ncbi:MAG: dioxygenase [Alphaproteobacteria bacterium]|nr:dioxygenase [Alphaproteobacteria bacterium]
MSLQTEVKAAKTLKKDVYFRPRRLGHSNLWVSNIKRSENFYNKVCGFTVEFWEPDLVATFLGTGHTPHDIGMIEVTGGKARYGRDGLLQIPAGVGAEKGLGHIAFEVENEKQLVDAYFKAKNAGAIKKEQTVDHQIAHSIYTFDPDGNCTEFYCDTVKDWRKVIHGEMSLISGNWTPAESEMFTDSRWDPNPEIRVVTDAPVHPRRVTHVVLKTKDMANMVDYYTGLGGMPVVHEAKDGSIVCVRGSHSGYRYNVGIVACIGDEKPGYHRTAFELATPADVDAAEKRCKANDIAIERSVDHASKRAIFLLDPDGLRTEYFASKTTDFVDLSKESAKDRAFLI